MERRDPRNVGGLRRIRDLSFTPTLIRRLTMQKELESHTGCVNTVVWNSDGGLLVSGSDDTRIKIWDMNRLQLKHSFDTEHEGNIFCARFMPFTNDRQIVTCAADGGIRYIDLEKNTCKHISCHESLVHKLALDPASSSVFYSCSDDGTVRMHDVRQAHACAMGTGGTSGCGNVVVDLRRQPGGGRSVLRRIGLHSVAISETSPHLLACAGRDQYLRLFDRRALSPSGSVRATAPVAKFAPSHLRASSSMRLQITGTAFAPAGPWALATYSTEDVYLFDVSRGENEQGEGDAEGPPLGRRPLVLPRPARPAGVTPEAAAAAGDPERAAREGDAGFVGPMPMPMPAPAPEARAYAVVGEAGPLSLASLDPERRAGPSGSGGGGGGAKREGAPGGRSGSGSPTGPRDGSSSSKKARRGAGGGGGGSADAEAQSAGAAAGVPVPGTPERVADELRRLREVRQRREAAAAARAAAAAAGGEGGEGGNSGGAGGAGGAAAGSSSSAASHVGPGARFRRQARDAETQEEEEEEQAEAGAEEEEEEEQEEEQTDSDREIVVEEDEGEEDEDEDDEEEDEDEDEEGGDGSSDSGLGPEEEEGGGGGGPRGRRRAASPERRLDGTYAGRYGGHSNIRTIKEVSFLGPRAQFVASGSDCGRLFVWDRRTGALVNFLKGDRHVVNCVQAHPFDCVLASSGIDNSVKVWTPTREEATALPDRDRVLAKNKRALAHERNGMILVPRSVLRRILLGGVPGAAAGPGEEGEGDEDEPEDAQCSLM
eukprot:tig00020610_g12034.t1